MTIATHTTPPGSNGAASLNPAATTELNDGTGRDVKTGRFQPGNHCGAQFQPGNKAAKGNPANRQSAAWIAALYAAVTAEELFALWRKMYECALAGDWAAAKLILHYGIGKPAGILEIDLHVAHHQQQQQPQPQLSALEKLLQLSQGLLATCEAEEDTP
jgi:hypothetical protein